MAKLIAESAAVPMGPDLLTQAKMCHRLHLTQVARAPINDPQVRPTLLGVEYHFGTPGEGPKPGARHHTQPVVAEALGWGEEGGGYQLGWHRAGRQEFWEGGGEEKERREGGGEKEERRNRREEGEGCGQRLMPGGGASQTTQERSSRPRSSCGRRQRLSKGFSWKWSFWLGTYGLLGPRLFISHHAG